MESKLTNAESIHSAIQSKPLEIQYGTIDKSTIYQLLNNKNQKGISCHNKKREIRHNTVYVNNYTSERCKEVLNILEKKYLLIMKIMSK